jgi:hypothetical protein
MNNEVHHSKYVETQMPNAQSNILHIGLYASRSTHCYVAIDVDEQAQSTTIQFQVPNEKPCMAYHCHGSQVVP